MSWSFNIGRIAGTAILVHVTFVLFLGWIFVASWVAGGPESAWQALAFMLLLFACVVAHEFGHIFTARAFGVTTPDVVLLPIGGPARAHPGGAVAGVPDRHRRTAGERGDRRRAGLLAGAQVNAVNLYAVENPATSMIDRLAAVNLFLAVFNMIPAFPMDGGRVLRAVLAARMGDVRATEIAAFVGQGVAFALGFIGLLYNPLLIFIAIFVYLAASSEAHLVAIRAMSRGVPVSAAMMTQFATLTPEAHVEEAVQTLLRTSQGNSPWSMRRASRSACSGAATSFARSRSAVPTPVSATRWRPRCRPSRSDAASTRRSACCRKNPRPPSPWSTPPAAWSASSPPRPWARC